MDYGEFIKKFTLPPGFRAPQEIAYEDMIARPLGRNDIDEDLLAVNSSAEVIRRTRGGSWPEKQLDKEFDFLDLAWHEREFREATSFAYVIYGSHSRYIGAFYLYPMGVRTALTEELLRYDADASWWVTTDAYEGGYYEKVYRALNKWIADEFPFESVYYSNREIPQS